MDGIGIVGPSYPLNEDALAFKRVVIGNHTTPVSTLTNNILIGDNIVDSSGGSVTVNLPEISSVDINIHYTFTRSGKYDVILAGSVNDLIEDFKYYPVRGKSVTLYSDGSKWNVYFDSSPIELYKRVVPLDLPINSVVMVYADEFVSRTPEHLNYGLVEPLLNQSIVTTLPSLFDQTISVGTQVFCSTSIVPVVGSDVPYLIGDPYFGGHPYKYVGHVSEVLSGNTVVLKLTNERNYVEHIPRQVTILDGVTTWFRIPETATSLANLSDVATDIETNSTDGGTVSRVYYIDNSGVNWYDNINNFNDGIIPNNSIVGVEFETVGTSFRTDWPTISLV